ncbi:hypothetical protein F0365_11365 [Nonlabens sp. Ci31]|uniref:hypothetical protein n=1 Tax=Nonlabens sp. Ci31 TaxID=2608253 RepID=UPI00146293BD|nr:hypothetical protein [Nonlabens sp. Ci31]QJP34943.1 hypothetical protein F0365_11365 [Nonlabens sp. Ci31]
MKNLKLSFLILVFANLPTLHAQSDFEVRITQTAYVEDYNNLAEYIGNENVTIHQNKIGFSKRLGNKMVLLFNFTADRVRNSDGRTYYNVKRKGHVVFADVNRVYENGERIILEMNSNGYSNQVQVPGENWTEIITNRSDFSITVKDDIKRKEVLRIMNYLRRYPVYRVKN